MAKKLHHTAQALLDAHVAYMTAQLSGKTLHTLIETELDFLLEDAAHITLNEAVTRDMIKETAHSYAVDMELSGAIPELVGDIARRLYTHPIHNFTTLGDLLPDHLFEEFLDKILEMDELRERVIHEAIANPVYAELVSNIVVEAMRGYARQGTERARKIPGAAQAARLGQTIFGAAIPALEEGMDDNLRRYLRKGLQSVLDRSEHFLLEKFDPEKIRLLVLDFWDNLKQRRITDIREGVSALDVEEFFVIIYEVWRELRQGPFYTALIDSGIDGFFDKYGDLSLRDIMEEMSVTRDVALRDALRFGPPVIDMLKKKKMLEPILRRNLEGFYSSTAVRKILDNSAEAK